MIASFFGILSFLLALGSMLAIPRSYSLLVWMPVCIFILFGLWCVPFGLCQTLHLPYSVVVIVLMNYLIFAAIVCLRFLRSEKLFSKSQGNGSLVKIAVYLESPKPQFASKRDIIVTLVIVAVVVICALRQFGVDVPVNFQTSDPVNHFLRSLSILFDGVDAGPFASHLVTAFSVLLMEPFLSPFDLYMSYALCELLLFLLSGMMFYSLVVVSCTKLKTVATCILVLLYMLGFPWNDLIFGFSYLGFGVTAIIAALFFCVKLEKDDSSIAPNLVAIALMLYLLISSYPLFVPPIYVGVFILVLRTCKRRGMSLRLSLLTAILLFAYPVIVGYFAVYVPLFGDVGGSSSSNLTVDSAISLEGYTYRNLYSDFIFIAPLAVFGFIMARKPEPIHAMNPIALVFVLFSMLLFALGMCAAVSSYYFFKTYYVLWGLFFIYASYGVQALKEQSPKALISYSMVWTLLFSMWFFGIDRKISESDTKKLFNLNPVASTLFAIYDSNRANTTQSRYDIATETTNFIRMSDELIETGQTVFALCPYEDFKWFVQLADIHDQPSLFNLTEEDVLEDIEGYDYLLVLYGHEDNVTKDGVTLPELIGKVEGELVPRSQLIESNNAGFLIRLH